MKGCHLNAFIACKFFSYFKRFFRYLCLSYRTSVIFLVLVIGSVLSFPAKAEFGVSIGYGLGADLNAYRLAFQIPTFACCEVGCIWPMSGFLEISLNQLAAKNNSNAINNNNDTLFGAAINHTFRFTQENFSACIFPYVEFAPGVIFLGGNNIHNHHLGNHTLVELKGGVGFRFGRERQYDLSYKFIRFSNTGHILGGGGSNNAINLSFIVLNFWF